MERPAVLIRARQAFTIIAAAAAICGASAAPASAAWSSPAQIAAPSSIDVLGPQVALSPAGTAAVSFNEVNLDAQATASAWLALASPDGGFGVARTVGARVQEILALAYSGRTLELLTANGPPGQPCCSNVQVIRRRPGGTFTAPQTIVKAVGGGTLGRLVALSNGRLLAVIVAPDGIWVTEARGTGSFAPAKMLTRAVLAPVPLAVAATAGGASTIVWTQGAAQSVISASGAPGKAPSRPHTVITVPTGHEIDGLQLVPRTGGSTVAWTESWNDTMGAYHSQAMAADLLGPKKPVIPRALSAPADVVSALALAADARGDEVAAWNVCSSALCALHTSYRGARSPRFGTATRLGRIDAVATPQLTMSPAGESLIGWITGEHVVVAQRGPKARTYTAPRPISGTLAANLDLAFGPTNEAAAIWTQGSLNPNVFAALSK